MPRTTWEPFFFVRCFSIFFESMRGDAYNDAASASPVSGKHRYGCWWWRWASFAILVVVAALTGASGTSGTQQDASSTTSSSPGRNCTLALSICALLLISAAVLFAIVAPFAVPAENLLNPLKLALLGSTCVVLAVLDRRHPDTNTALAVLSTLQAVVTVARLAVKLCLRLVRRSTEAAGDTVPAQGPPTEHDDTKVAANKVNTTLGHERMSPILSEENEGSSSENDKDALVDLEQQPDEGHQGDVPTWVPPPVAETDHENVNNRMRNDRTLCDMSLTVEELRVLGLCP